ncbi:hypothetical protein V8J88_23150 [Massilia sp. W12]|uniref:hypothetical protein n=1 Tax=Massilia sp. W12 TaxID=3126507 RepID=UPI0030D4D468
MAAFVARVKHACCEKPPSSHNLRAKNIHSDKGLHKSIACFTMTCQGRLRQFHFRAKTPEFRNTCRQEMEKTGLILQTEAVSMHRHGPLFHSLAECKPAAAMPVTTA